MPSVFQHIPYAALRVSSNLKSLLTPFAFSSGTLGAAPEEIILESGTYESVVIPRFHINDRRLVVKVLGSSKAADKVHEALYATLMKVAEHPTEDKPLLFVQETSCIAHLDFDAFSLLAQPVGRLIKTDLLEATSDRNVQASVSHLQVRVELRYKTKSDVLEANKIGLAPKAFVLEPMANVPFSERRYYTESPTDSETHLRLIESFERSISQR